MLRLVDLPRVGEGLHRSGWPYAIRALEPLFRRDATMLFDEFVERTFLYEIGQSVVHQQPWVAVFHHPPDIPSWYMNGQLDLRRLIDNPRWEQSSPHLRLGICLSKNQADWIQQHLGVPCVPVRHPTEVPALRWRPDQFLRNPTRYLVQIGSFLRNTRAINQVRSSPLLRKARLMQNAQWIAAIDEQCHARYVQHEGRSETGTVVQLSPMDDVQFDKLLSANVVFLELIASAASNTVVECIARNTPLVVNRQPGPVEYLGYEYPLFYDDITSVPDLLTIDRVLAAHEYLSRLDTSWISANAFCESIAQACQRAAVC